jgi:vitamin B12/bleomycin/antimicrobial peptide transport system ATP-binding/permease protein
MFAALILLLCGANGLNVVNSYVGRNFMTSIVDRNQAQFVRLAVVYIGVFAASTVVAVIARFAEERLGLMWREFVTGRLIGFYLADGAYYRLIGSPELTNPDQRISEDARTFTVTTLSFALMAFNSAFTIVAFSEVLWLISPLLFVVSLAYAACGSLLTIALGRPLIKLNYDQLDKEAVFRSGLIHVRENAESIMLAHSERRQTQRLLHQLADLAANFRQIIAVNRNVGFFTTGYNWLIQIIPALIVAPSYMSGKVEFGVISQAAVAFSAIVAAFSLIVTQFQSLSNYAAVTARLSGMIELMEGVQSAAKPPIETVEAGDRLEYERLTLLQSANGAPLLKDLSISIPPRGRVLVTGPNESARTALFKATAGVWTVGAGRIVVPGSGGVLFLSQRPYLPQGTIRQLLSRPGPGDASDERILALMAELGLDQVIADAGGMDAEQDWSTLLSLREQQLLSFAHILLYEPGFAFLDRVAGVLAPAELSNLLRKLSERSIGYVNSADENESEVLYDGVLECREDGGWTWTPRRA